MNQNNALVTIKEEEEEQDFTEDEKKIKIAQKLLFEISRNKKNIEEMKFIQLFKELNQGSRFQVLNNMDTVGWTAVHYLILFDNQGLLRTILDIYGVEMLNLTSQDGWSPLLLATQQKNWKIVRLFLNVAQQQQCELQSVKGSLLHELFQNAPFDIIRDLIVEIRVDAHKKDFNGVVALDLIKDNIKPTIHYLIKIMEIPQKPVSLLGKVQKYSMFFGWMDRYLRLNAQNRVLERYKKQRHIPFRPREVMPLKNIENFKIEEPNAHISTKEMFICFTYDSEEHRYRIDGRDGEIWRLFFEKSFKWNDYYEKFPGNKGNEQYRDKIQQIWNGIDKEYQERELLDDQQRDQIVKEFLLPLQQDKPKVTLQDFYILELLGRGAFARVYKVLHKKSKKIFAMKLLKKENLIKYQQEKYSQIEKKILEDNKNNPYLLSLHFAFQDQIYLYMVVDYCPNGDLSILLAKQSNNKFNEEQVRVYSAQILLAIEDLHKRDYIY